MGCKVFNNGKNKNCGLININQENIRKIIEEQKTNNIIIHNNHNRNIFHSNRRIREHRNEMPVRNYINTFFAPHLRYRNPLLQLFRNRSVANNVNHYQRHRRRNHLVSNRNENNRRNYSTRSRLRERNDSQPNSINQIPRENALRIIHVQSQRNELERIDNQFMEQNEIDSNNNNSEGNNIIDNFCEVKIKNISKLEESNKKCAICLEKFNSKVKVIILPCIHIFHRSCINNWMKKQKNCPICKFELTKENIDQKNDYILNE
jgi:hypothetical protein